MKTSFRLSDQGEVLFRADVSGGTQAHGLFIYQGGTIRKVVAPGDPTPGGGTFSSIELWPSPDLNNRPGGYSRHRVRCSA